MRQPIHEVIIDLLISYSTKESTPTVSEILAVENAMPYIEGHLEAGTYQSYVEWIERNKLRYSEEEGCAFEEASHVLVESERFDRLTPNRLYAIVSDKSAEETGSSQQDPYQPIVNRHIIDDYGREYDGFLTLKGVYMKRK